MVYPSSNWAQVQSHGTRRLGSMARKVCDGYSENSNMTSHMRAETDHLHSPRAMLIALE